MKDYYSILGVQRNASQSDIQKAFRTLAKKHHPDAGGDEKVFKEINEAYQVLNNIKKRQQYDAGSYGGPGSSGGKHAGFEGFDFSHFDMGGSSFEDLFSGIFKNAMNRGRDVQIDVQITFKESIFGVEKNISIPYRNKKTETIKVSIPAGIEHGQGVALNGKGEPGRDKSSRPGDLIIRVVIEKHATLTRHGADLVYPLSLTISEALLGTIKKIKDLKDEKIKIIVPGLTKEGSTILIQGHGIPRPAGNDRLIILCHIKYPKRLSSKEKELLSELQKEGL